MTISFKNIRVLSLYLFAFNVTVFAQTKVLYNAHAHNDYEHTHPLTDALNLGFNSIEVDVFLIEGELYVYHDKPLFQSKKRTLKNLYLKPLWKKLVKHRGKLYEQSREDFMLMIDIKTEADKTYTKILEQLSFLKPYLSYSVGDTFVKKGMYVYVSGNRPKEMIVKQDTIYVGIDGRPQDLHQEYKNTVMPVVSQRFSKISIWDGEKTISEVEKVKILDFVNATKNKGMKSRLWAIPDHKLGWKTLLDLGVDYINTDKLKAFKEFASQYIRKQKDTRNE